MRVVKDDSSTCNDSGIACIYKQISAISFQVTNTKGEVLLNQSLNIKDIKNQVELKNVKEDEHATLTVSVFGFKNGEADYNTVRWLGKADGLKFKKGETTTAEIQLYPTAIASNEYSMHSSLELGRFGHSATLLGDGRILIAGGFTSCDTLGKCPATDSVEIIDIESGKIETLEPMSTARAMHKAVPLGDGSVVFIGGVQGFNSTPQDDESVFENFNKLPYYTLGAVTTMERYMPSYPKHNMEINGIGTANKSYTEKITAEIPFRNFQSVLVAKISDTQTDVFLVGGVDADENKPSGKAHKFSLRLSEQGDFSVSDVTDLAESSEPMLLPALAYNNGSILAVGGRPKDSEYTASVISESSSENRLYKNSKNLFFTNSIDLDGTLYTFGGFASDPEQLVNSNQNVITRWSFSSDSVTNGKHVLKSWDKTVAFAETLYDEKNNSFIVIGGTNAEDIYQVIDASTLDLYDNSPTHQVLDNKNPDKRIMPKAVIVPVKSSITKNPMIVISGGISVIHEAILDSKWNIVWRQLPDVDFELNIFTNRRSVKINLVSQNRTCVIGIIRVNPNK